MHRKIPVTDTGWLHVSKPHEVAHTDARWSKFATGWNAGRDELFAFLIPTVMTVVRRPEAAMPSHDGDDTTEHTRVSATLAGFPPEALYEYVLLLSTFHTDLRYRNTAVTQRENFSPNRSEANPCSTGGSLLPV